MQWGLAGVVVATLLAVVFRRYSFVLLGFAAALALLSWFGRCRHPGRLGLLPPRTAGDGTRIPARWFCDKCGESWPATFEHDRAPVLKFAGYDQSKAPRAAQRAAELDRRRHDLALRRAGLLVSRPTTAKEPAQPAVLSIVRAGRSKH